MCINSALHPYIPLNLFTGYQNSDTQQLKQTTKAEQQQQQQ